MQLNLDPEISWDCPEGTHNATLVEIREIQKPSSTGVQTLIRLVFQIDDLCSETKYVYVGKNFPPSLKQGAALRLFLECWLGEDFFKNNRQGNKVDLEQLKGMKGVLQVHRIENEGHDKPYCNIQGIGPAKTTTATNNSPATETTTKTGNSTSPPIEELTLPEEASEVERQLFDFAASLPTTPGLSRRAKAVLTRVGIVANYKDKMGVGLTTSEMYDFFTLSVKAEKKPGVVPMDYMEFQALFRQSFKDHVYLLCGRYEVWPEHEAPVQSRDGSKQPRYCIWMNVRNLDLIRRFTAKLKFQSQQQDKV